FSKLRHSPEEAAGHLPASSWRRAPKTSILQQLSIRRIRNGLCERIGQCSESFICLFGLRHRFYSSSFRALRRSRVIAVSNSVCLMPRASLISGPVICVDNPLHNQLHPLILFESLLDPRKPLPSHGDTLRIGHL